MVEYNAKHAIRQLTELKACRWIRQRASGVVEQMTRLSGRRHSATQRGSVTFGDCGRTGTFVGTELTAGTQGRHVVGKMPMSLYT